MITRKRLNLSTCLTDGLRDQSKQQEEETILIQKVKEENEEEEVDNANIIIRNEVETQTCDIDANGIQNPYALKSVSICSKLVAQVENTEYEKGMKLTILNATCNSDSEDTDDQDWETTSCSSQDGVAKNEPAKKSIFEIQDSSELKLDHLTDNEVIYLKKSFFHISL